MIQNSDNLDPTIEEIHRIREQMAAKFGGNLTAILDDARKRQAASGRPTWQGPHNNPLPSSPAPESDSPHTSRE